MSYIAVVGYRKENFSGIKINVPSVVIVTNERTSLEAMKDFAESRLFGLTRFYVTETDYINYSEGLNARVNLKRNEDGYLKRYLTWD